MEPGSYKLYVIEKSDENEEDYTLNIYGKWNLNFKTEWEGPYWSGAKQVQSYKDMLNSLLSLLSIEIKPVKLQISKATRGNIPPKAKGLAEKIVKLHNEAVRLL